MNVNEITARLNTLALAHQGDVNDPEFVKLCKLADELGVPTPVTRFFQWHDTCRREPAVPPEDIKAIELRIARSIPITAEDASKLGVWDRENVFVFRNQDMWEVGVLQGFKAGATPEAILRGEAGWE